MKKVFVYVSLMMMIVLGKREAPKESVYVEYDDWSYEPSET